MSNSTTHSSKKKYLWSYDFETAGLQDNPFHRKFAITFHGPDHTRTTQYSIGFDPAQEMVWLEIDAERVSQSYVGTHGRLANSRICPVVMAEMRSPDRERLQTAIDRMWVTRRKGQLSALDQLKEMRK